MTGLALFGYNNLCQHYLQHQPIQPDYILDNHYGLTGQTEQGISICTPNSELLQHINKIVICLFSSYPVIYQQLLQQGFDHKQVYLYLPLKNTVIPIHDLQKSPLILICNSMHKAASKWLLSIFQEGLKHSVTHTRKVLNFEHYEFNISPHALIPLRRTGGFTCDHFLPSEINAEVINHFADRFIFSVRQPRTAIISMWFEHYQLLGQPYSADTALLLKLAGLPEDFYQLPELVAAKTFIQVTYTQLLEWLERWMVLIAESIKVPVYILKYEYWKAQPHVIAQEVEQFLELPAQSIIFSNDPRATLSPKIEQQQQLWQQKFASQLEPLITELTPQHLVDPYATDH